MPLWPLVWVSGCVLVILPFSLYTFWPLGSIKIAEIALIGLFKFAEPLLLQRMTKAEGPELTHACSAALAKLKSAGLDDVDSAIVMKSFVDEAKGGADWYANSALVKSCFSQAPSIEANVEKIYGSTSKASSQAITP
jgi:hypothetical protein